MKQCTKCGVEKPEDAFEMQPSRGRRRSECRECRRVAGKEWLAKRRLNPPQCKAETKLCSRCQKVKPVSEFSPSNPGYFHGRCKECEKAVHQEKRREQYRNNPTGRYHLPFMNEAGIMVKRCTRCHIEKPVNAFYANGYEGRIHGKCKECDKAIRKGYYDANPEKYRAQAREYGQIHAEENHARRRRWGGANRQYCLQYNREYNTAHREEKRQGYRARRMNMSPDDRKAFYARHNFTRRARQIGAPRTETIDRQAIIERDKWTCYLCGQICTHQNVTLDHVIPLARGGSHTTDNLCVACSPCNTKKGVKMLGEFLA